jgi:hypothetical protein
MIANYLNGRPKVPLKRPRKGGEMASLQTKVWFAILHVERVLDDPESSASMRLQAAHALSQLAHTYVHCLQHGFLSPH